MALFLIKELILIDNGLHDDKRLAKYINDMSDINLIYVLIGLRYGDIDDIGDDIFDIIAQIVKEDKEKVVYSLNIWTKDNSYFGSENISYLNKYLKKHIDNMFPPMRPLSKGHNVLILHSLIHHSFPIACMLLKRYKDKIKGVDAQDITDIAIDI